MGIFKLINRLLITISILVIFISSSIYSKELTKDEFYGLTLKDALDYSDNGKPIDIFLDFKKQNGGKVDTSYGDYVGLNGDAYYYELDERIYNEEKLIKDNIAKGEDEIKKVASERLKYEKQSFVREYFKSNIVKVLLIVLCLLGILVGVIVLKNRIVIIASMVLLLVLIVSLNLISLFTGIKQTDKVIEYLNNEHETLAIKMPISDETENSSFEYMTEDEYIKKMCDKKYDIASVINEYILKIYYCVRQRAQNKEFNYSKLGEVVNYTDINKEREYAKKEELLDRNTYLDNDPFDYGINAKTISFDEMEYIYNNITDEDIENFNNGNFINKFLNEIKQNIKYIDSKDFEKKEMLLSRYLVSKINSRALCEDFFEDEILRELKDWYIEDENEIELPFGVTLKFEKQKFVKKDIKEIIGTDIDDKNLIVYYKDSDGNIHGDFVLDDYKDVNNHFNKTDIIYNIKKAVLTMNVNGFKPYYNYDDIDVYDKNGQYIVSVDKREAIDDNNMSRGTNRDLSMLHMLLMKKQNMGKLANITNYSFTQNFINKFKVQDNIYEIIPYNIVKTEVIKINKKIAKTDKLIRKLILEDGIEMICIFKVIWTDNYEVDDVLTYIVPEDKMNLSYEEMYQLAFNE